MLGDVVLVYGKRSCMFNTKCTSISTCTTGCVREDFKEWFESPLMDTKYQGKK